MAVTRFAPSPTGYLHVGGARTALFNWLWARKTGGTFILRIEDTDQKRNTPTAAEQVMRDLQWLGVDWDLGPKLGQEPCEYYQSQRLGLYTEYLEKLLEAGQAYYCFDTPEELAEMRAQAEKAKQGFIYRAPEKLPGAGDVEKAKNEGRPVTVRMKIPMDRPIVVEDVIRGQVEFQPGELADFIIQKSDGFPTYHFACVVDDALMGVTDVIRGQEHLMNTPLHQVLQDALGFDRPNYAHMAVTVSEGGGKLSKRERPKTLKKELKAIQNLDIDTLAEAAEVSHAEIDAFVNGKEIPDMPVVDAIAACMHIPLPEINVVDFIRSGYLPETMVNFLALLGWNPGDNREVMRTDEIIEAFDLKRLSKANSLFDRKKLLSFNTEHIKMAEKETLRKHFLNYLEVTASPLTCVNEAMLDRLLEANAGAKTLEQIEQKCRFIVLDDDKIPYDEKAVQKVLLKNNGLAILAEIASLLKALDPVTPESLEQMLRSLAEEKQVGLGKVAQPLRVAVSGSTVSLGIFDSIDILGIEKTLTRIHNTLERFKND